MFHMQQRKRDPEAYKDVETRGDIGSRQTSESEVARIFDEAMRANGIPFESEVRGKMRGNLNGKEAKNVRADRIIYPTEHMLDQGYAMGPAIVELKGSSAKLGTCFPQVLDYRMSWFFPRHGIPCYMERFLSAEEYSQGFLKPSIAYIYPRKVWANQGHGSEHLSLSGGVIGALQNQFRIGSINIRPMYHISFHLGSQMILSSSPSLGVHVAEEGIQNRGLQSGSR